MLRTLYVVQFIIRMSVLRKLVLYFLVVLKTHPTLIKNLLRILGTALLTTNWQVLISNWLFFSNFLFVLHLEHLRIDKLAKIHCYLLLYQENNHVEFAKKLNTFAF